MSSAAIRRAPPANVITVTGVFPATSNPLLPCAVQAPGKLALDGRRFRVRAEGSVIVTVGTTTLKPQLLAALTMPATPLTIGNWTAISAGTAQACPTTGCPWWIDADLIYDSNSGLLHGTIEQMVANTFVARAAITGVITGINGTNNVISQAGTPVQPQDPVVQFAMGATLSAAGSVTLANFEVAF